MAPKKTKNPWIAHVQEFAKAHPELSYREAMGDPECKSSYEKKKAEKSDKSDKVEKADKADKADKGEK